MDKSEIFYSSCFCSSRSCQLQYKIAPAPVGRPAVQPLFELLLLGIQLFLEEIIQIKLIGTMMRMTKSRESLSSVSRKPTFNLSSCGESNITQCLLGNRNHIGDDDDVGDDDYNDKG